MICRLTRLKCVEHTGLVHGQTNCILRPLLLLASAGAGILVNLDILFLPRLRLLLRWLLLLLRLLITLISRTLATVGACLLFFYGHHLGRTVPVIQPIISLLVPVIGAIELPRSTDIVVVPLAVPLTLQSKRGLQWVSQCITVCNLDCLGQRGQHISLELLPQHGVIAGTPEQTT
jgi:hypothetical protein